MLRSHRKMHNCMLLSSGGKLPSHVAHRKHLGLNKKVTEGINQCLHTVTHNSSKKRKERIIKAMPQDPDSSRKMMMMMAFRIQSEPVLWLKRIVCV